MKGRRHVTYFYIYIWKVDLCLVTMEFTAGLRLEVNYNKAIAPNLACLMHARSLLEINGTIHVSKVSWIWRQEQLFRTLRTLTLVTRYFHGISRTWIGVKEGHWSGFGHSTQSNPRGLSSQGTCGSEEYKLAFVRMPPCMFLIPCMGRSPTL